MTGVTRGSCITVADEAAGWHDPAMRIAPLLLLLVPIASGCDDGDRRRERADSPETEMVKPPQMVWGEVDTTRFTRLGSEEILTALSGHVAAYEPPGTADAGANEEFHEDGRWAGVRLSRGPIPFSGRWEVRNGRLCVTAEDGYVAGQLRDGPLCRAVWRDPRGGDLLMEHAMAQGRGLLRLSVGAIAGRSS